jgi:hypothetical protein
MQNATTALKKTSCHVVFPLTNVVIISSMPSADLLPHNNFPDTKSIKTNKIAKYFPNSHGIIGSNECNLPTDSHNGKYKNPIKNKCLNRPSSFKEFINWVK